MRPTCWRRARARETTSRTDPIRAAVDVSQRKGLHQRSAVSHSSGEKLQLRQTDTGPFEAQVHDVAFIDEQEY
jgi:hypothetical protein